MIVVQLFALGLLLLASLLALVLPARRGLLSSSAATVLACVIGTASSARALWLDDHSAVKFACALPFGALRGGLDTLAGGEAEGGQLLASLHLGLDALSAF